MGGASGEEVTSHWVEWPGEMWVEAAERARDQVLNYTKRQMRGRTHAEAFEETFRGLVAEMFHNRDDLDDWRKRWQQAQSDHDDGGSDDKLRRNVKAILGWQRYVFAHGYWRSNEFVVYEVDRDKKRVRHRGTFKPEDVKEIAMDDGRTIPGVLVESLR